MNLYSELHKVVNYHDCTQNSRIPMPYLKGKELREKFNELSSSRIIFVNHLGVKFYCSVEISDQEKSLSQSLYEVGGKDFFLIAPFICSGNRILLMPMQLSQRTD